MSIYDSGDWSGKQAPELKGGEWLNSDPLSLAALRGKVVIVDFWEYSCINCIRTLPYLTEWYKRYRELGFEIIGVHVPEFEFGKKKENVERAIKKLGITWPVMLDNDYKTWNAYNNNVWPRELLIDAQGIVVHDQSGEGGYQETESNIQRLLKMDNPKHAFPELMQLVRETDNPHRVCYRTSPELYAGYDRGRLGNPEGLKTGEVVSYAEPKEDLEEDVIYVAGDWKNEAERLSPVAPNDMTWLGLKYHAKGVYAVIKPESETRFKVFVTQDGKAVPKEAAGEDLQIEERRSFFMVDEPRMYRIVNNPEFGVHKLMLHPTSASFGFYTFTFESACET